MKIDRINYKKIFPIAPYINEQIGVEIQLDETDKPDDALDTAKRIVESWHKGNNPSLAIASSNGQVPEVQIKDIKDLEKIEDFFIEHKKDMNAEELKTFKRVIENREVSSYQKLIKIIDGVRAVQTLENDKKPNKKRKL